MTETKKYLPTESKAFRSRTTCWSFGDQAAKLRYIERSVAHENSIAGSSTGARGMGNNIPEYIRVCILDVPQY